MSENMNLTCDLCWDDIDEIDVDAEFGSDIEMVCSNCQTERWSK